MLRRVYASLRLVATVLALSLVLSGCFLRRKSASGTGAATFGGLIIRDSIVLDRIGDGDSAQLQFKTTANAICQMAFYTQDPNTPPTQANPTVVPCSNQDQPRTDFSEELDGLRVDQLYMVTLSAWLPGGSAGSGDIVLVRESPSTSSVVGDDGTTLLSELLVAQFDLPLKTAEVHRTTLPTPLATADIKTKVTRSIGCQTQVPAADAAFRDATGDAGISSLTTEDLAAGTAAAHPDYPGRLQLSYPSLNDGVDQWTLLYQYNSNDHQVPITPVARLQNIEMESSQIVSFDPPDISKPTDALKIDAAKPLKFSWTVGSNLLDLTYVTVQIGRPNYEKSVYCIFPAAQLSGVVDPKYLQALDDGTHVVLTEMSETEIYVKDGWLVTMYDWRSGQIEK